MSDLPEVQFPKNKKRFKYLLHGHMLGPLERLVGCSSNTIFAGMGPFLVILLHTLIEIVLYFLDGVIVFLVKRYLVELFLNGAMEMSTNAIGLVMAGIGLGVIDVFDRQR